MSTLYTLIDLPFSLYGTFGIEEKFGFNNQTVGSYLVDEVKELAIHLGTNGLFYVALQTILAKFGRSFIPYATLTMMALTVLMPPFEALVITPLFYKKEQLAAGELRTRIEELATSHGFPNDRIMVIDSSSKSGHSNAYFIGMPWFREIVLYDTLISDHTTDGVLAILAHELGHWKGNHIMKQITLRLPKMMLNFLSWVLLLDNKHFQRSMGFPAVFPPNSFPDVGALLYTLTEPINLVFTFLANTLSRRFEYEADDFSFQLGYGKALREALITLATSNLSAVYFDPMYATLYRNHPSPLERVERIDEVSKKQE